MTLNSFERQEKHLQLLSDSLDIPDSHYARAEQRHLSLGKWLERENSTVAKYFPKIFPQGSFKIGTVTPSPNGYDLDIVCELQDLSKADISQSQLKEMVGHELELYADSHSMNARPISKKRCWHIDYADEVKFHIDILPSIPESESQKAITSLRIDHDDLNSRYSETAIAITDNTEASYSSITDNWPSSNPRGYARWFEDAARPAAQELHASVRKFEELPPNRWKTPLQVAIKILKQHRDQMFKENPDVAPISIIISTLAAKSYTGQVRLRETIESFISLVPKIVDRNNPVIFNPVNPNERFTDKWEEDPELAESFWFWLDELSRTFNNMGFDLTSTNIADLHRDRFGVEPPEEAIRKIGILGPSPTILTATVGSKSRPWGIDAD